MAVLNRARFKINSTPAEDPSTGDRGYQATNAQVLTCVLEATPPITDVQTVVYEVHDPAASDSPEKSSGSPDLTWTVSGQPKEELTDPSSSVTITMPASGSHSYVLRCRARHSDGEDVFEREVSVLTSGGLRKVVDTERALYRAAGWAADWNLLVEAVDTGVVGTLAGDVTGQPGSNQVDAIQGVTVDGAAFAAPTNGEVLQIVGGQISLATLGGTISGLTDNRVVRADGTSNVQNSGVELTDTEQLNWTTGDVDVQRAGTSVLKRVATSTQLFDANGDLAAAFGTTSNGMYAPGGLDLWVLSTASLTAINFAGDEFVGLRSTGLKLNAFVGELQLQRQGTDVVETTSSHLQLRSPAAAGTGQIEFYHDTTFAGLLQQNGNDNVFVLGGDSSTGAYFTAGIESTGAGHPAVLLGGPTTGTNQNGGPAYIQGAPGTGTGTGGNAEMRDASGNAMVRAKGDGSVAQMGNLSGARRMWMASTGPRIANGLSLFWDDGGGGTDGSISADGTQMDFDVAGTVELSLLANVLRFPSASTTPVFGQEATSTADATGQALTMQSQGVTGSGTSITGGVTQVFGGDADSGTATARDGGSVIVGGGLGGGTGGAGNVALATQSEPNWQGMHGGAFVARVGTEPSTQASSGVFVYAVDRGSTSDYLRIDTGMEFGDMLIRSDGGVFSLQRATNVGDTAGSTLLILGQGNDSATEQAGPVEIKGGVNANAGGPQGTARIVNRLGAIVIEAGGGGTSSPGQGVLAFFESTPITKQTISGARNDPESALANLLSWIDTIGLATDGTTAT